MINGFASLIQRRPWLVVLLIIIVTIGFASFIPSLEYKTNFEDFAPDNDLVKANNRITDYFGGYKQMLFLIVDTEQGNSTITPQALREQYRLQHELLQLNGVNSTIGFTLFLDTVCLMEFNETIENCTDEQLQTALNDLLHDAPTGEFKVFSTDDPDEATQAGRAPRLRPDTNSEGNDIKNCYITKDNTSFSFSFEVYDLSSFSSNINPVISRVNIMEWYLGFENALFPPDIDMKYELSVRIEPLAPRWEIGRGLLENLRHRRDGGSLFSPLYTSTAYLWLKPPGQDMYFPLPLTNATIDFDTSTNRIVLTIPREELGKYGIGTTFGSFELPAKLTSFSAGVRYYQTKLFHRLSGRIEVNTSFLFNRLERMQNRPFVGALFARMLSKYGVSLDDFSQMSSSTSMSAMLPETISLHDLRDTWKTVDTAPDTGVSDTSFSIIPQFFKDLRVNALSFISTDYEETQQPHKALIIVQLDDDVNGDTIDTIDADIIKTVAAQDKQLDHITVQVTGESIVSKQINDVTMDANTILGPAMFVLIIVVLFINFRRPSYVFLPILVFGFSCIWLFGTMALLGIPFNIIAVALLPLNIGLGVEYSVNMLHNYRVEIEQGKTPAEAIRRSIKDVGVAIFLAWFTTFVAFLSFLTASIPPVRDFGIFLALGITYTFIITLTLLTSLRFITDRKRPPRIKTKKETFSARTVMDKIPRFILRHEKAIYALTIIICLVMGVAVTQVKTGFSMEQFIPQDNPALQQFRQIEENFPFSSQDQEYILVEGNVATVKALQGVAQTQKNLDDDTFVAKKADGSTKVESVYSIITQAVDNNQSLVSLYNLDVSTHIPKTDADVARFYDYFYESDEYSQQIATVLYKNNSRYEATIIRVYTYLQSNDSDMLDDFQVMKKDFSQDLTSFGDAKPTVTGMLLITLTIMNSMTESQIVSTAVCFLLAAIMLSLIYRNPVLGLVTMIPVSASIIWVLGTMYFIGYTLNVLTITVTCITIGVGIDYGVYITERFRLTVDRTGDITTAVCQTISRTGSAMFIAALSSMFGFGVLMLAPIPPQQQFGLITAITLIYSFITSIFVLPLVLARWAAWRKKRRGYIIRPGAPTGEYDNDDTCGPT